MSKDETVEKSPEELNAAAAEFAAGLQVLMAKHGVQYAEFHNVAATPSGQCHAEIWTDSRGHQHTTIVCP